MKRGIVCLIFLACGCADAASNGKVTVAIGSKKFTESVVLGEMATQLAQNAGASAVHRHQLGGTQILWKALLAGDIDLYPEYTGTIAREILAGQNPGKDADLAPYLAKFGVRISQSLGFNNTYAIGIKNKLAEKLGIRTVSDLKQHPEFRFGFSDEFLRRSDGWPGLRERYGLPQKSVRGLDHDLAYIALENGSIDATDLYSTDAEISYHDLRVLADDLGYFPPYWAVFLYRADLESRAPGALREVLRLQGQISAADMTQMNAQAKRRTDRIPEAQIAANFLLQKLGITTRVQVESTAMQLWARTREHLYLVVVSLSLALVVALPLGVLGARWPAFGQGVLAAAGIIQTIPSLALLVFFIPFLGLGALPAIVALFLYSLLPIVRNTYAGLRGIPAAIHESALALGLPAWPRLWRIELPMASPTILAGIKTSAVINVGTATLGAIIGTGGYGEPIMTGIRLNDMGLILQGAIPAALMALAVQGTFEIAEKFLVPRGLRLKTEV
jgi:osmoprotectant transport system permease protein